VVRIQLPRRYQKILSRLDEHGDVTRESPFQPCLGPPNAKSTTADDYIGFTPSCPPHFTTKLRPCMHVLHTNFVSTQMALAQITERIRDSSVRMLGWNACGSTRVGLWKEEFKISRLRNESLLPSTHKVPEYLHARPV